MDSFVANAINDFAFRLAANLLRDGPGGHDSFSKNTVFSPYSIAAALTMTANGARGQTLEAMLEVLGLGGLRLDEANQAYAALMKALSAPGGGVELSIANAIWGMQGLNFLPDFGGFE